MTAIADSGDFGNVCVGSFTDEELTINNSGACPLLVTAINSSSGGVSGAAPFGYRCSWTRARRPRPRSASSRPVSARRRATITLISNDPAGPRTVSVSGVAPAPQAGPDDCEQRRASATAVSDPSRMSR